MISTQSLIAATCIALSASSASAIMLATGSAVYDYDAAAWASLAGGTAFPGFEGLVLDEWFDKAGADARTGAQIGADEMIGAPSSLGLISLMNGPTVTNLANRNTQATTFDYTPGTLIAHTGVIGLGGVTRWAVNPLLGGGALLAGDYTLAFDANRILFGGSGWALTNNIAPVAVVFDLKNVTTMDSTSGVSITGDLSLSPEVANFILQTPSDAGKDMGNFSFTASAIPEPSASISVFVGLAGLMLQRRRRR